jgi:hypothetical protein
MRALRCGSGIIPTVPLLLSPCIIVENRIVGVPAIDRVPSAWNRASDNLDGDEK